MLLTQISSIKYLLRQGLPLRGHDEPESNLIQLMKLLSQDVNAKELSLKIIQDIIQQILERHWFALICDEIADEANKEQLCIKIRSVDKQHVIHENVIEAIVDPLTKCGLNIKQCRGQGHDGAVNMGGIHEEVAAKILQSEKKAFYIRCNVHRLDLSIQDLTRQCSTMDTTITYTKDIIGLVQFEQQMNQFDYWHIYLICLTVLVVAGFLIYCCVRR
ncbi:unnamed protein product, partial [Didymodactylos carnosus]